MTTLQDLNNRMATISDLMMATNELLVTLGHKPMKVKLISAKDLATEKMQDQERELISSENY